MGESHVNEERLSLSQWSLDEIDGLRVRFGLLGSWFKKVAEG